MRFNTGGSTMEPMKATVFHSANNIRVEEVPRPSAGVGEAVIKITLTTICGTDLHILRGEYAVKPGLVIVAPSRRTFASVILWSFSRKVLSAFVRRQAQN